MPNPLVTIRSSSFSLYCCAVLVLALLSGCGGGGGGSSAPSFPGGLYSLGPATDDTLWFAAANGVNANFSVMMKP